MTQPCFRRLTLRTAMLAGASFTAVALGATQAPAGMFNRRPTDPAAAAAQAAASRATSSATAAAVAQKTLAAFSRAAAIRGKLDAAQAAARAAAAAAQSKVPDGLGAGGLQIGDGVGTDPSLWINAKGPVETKSGGETTVTIKQTGQSAILTWDTFNVGKNTTVYFDQSGGGRAIADWAVLNRIVDPRAAPSQILGHIKAQGQVYLINRNGILFGGASTVDVHGLVASSLDFIGDTVADRNAAFMRGPLVTPDENRPYPVLNDGGDYSNTYDPGIGGTVPGTENHIDGETFASGDGVTVAAGARITTDALGRVVLAGHNAINEGTIISPDGQVVLAAGRQVTLARNITPASSYFSQTTDPDLRGVTVAVDRGGEAANRNGGIIDTPRGNITLAGKSVLQDGLLTASTSARANGSIRLDAADGLSIASGPYPGTTHTGSLELTGDSLTEIVPDDTGELATGFSQFRPSKLELIGRTVTLDDGASVFAPAASMSIQAVLGNFDRVADGKNDSRLYLGDGATIDLGGLRDITKSVSDNVISAELRANELADSPVQRDGPLRSQTIKFDARYGTSIGNVSGYYDLIQRSASELMTGGGSLELESGTVIARKGSTIDLSGGAISYAGGYVNTTKLVDLAGNVVDIADADPNTVYAGIYGDKNVVHARWGVIEHFSSAFFRDKGRYEAGYVEGRDAGSLSFAYGDPSHGVVVGGAGNASDLGARILDGTIRGDVVVGEHQRDAPAAGNQTDPTAVWHERPQLAAFSIGVANAPNGFAQPGSIGTSITIGKTGTLLPGDFTATTALDPSLAGSILLSDTLFDGSTFGRVSLRSGQYGGDVTIAKGSTVDLGAFGSLSITATHATIAGNVIAPSGTVQIVTVDLPPNLVDPVTGQTPTYDNLPDSAKPATTVTGSIDVAGRFVNDVLNPAADTALTIDGGSVFVGSAQNLTLAKGSTIDVSGGGHLASDGRTLTAGKGGSVALVDDLTYTGVFPTADAFQQYRTGPGDGRLVVAGTLRGYGIRQGGSLTLGSPDAFVIIDDPASVKATPGEPAPTILSPDVFEQGGFQSFQIAGQRGVTLAAGTIVRPETQNIILAANGIDIADGARLGSKDELGVLPDALRGPIAITLANGARAPDGTLIYQVNLGQSGNLADADQVADPGSVTIGKGAAIDLTPGSSVTLRSYSGISIDGTIDTPGGTIIADVRPQKIINYQAGPVPEGGFRITLGDGARLLAGGYVRETPNGVGVVRSVEDGGQVTLTAANAQAAVTIDMAKSAVIDVSGVTGTADLFAPNSSGDPAQRPLVPVTVASNGGSIAIYAENGVIAGKLNAAPGGTGAAGGSIAIARTTGGIDNFGNFGPVFPGFPSLTLRQSTDGVSVDDALAANTLYVSADGLNDSAADAVALTTELAQVPGSGYSDALLFDGSVKLSTRGFLGLYANAFGTTAASAPGAAVTLSARNVEMGSLPLNVLNSGSNSGNPAQPPARVDATLTVRADTIDLTGGFDLGCGASCTGQVYDPYTDTTIDIGQEAGGFARADFIATHDIRLNPLGQNGRGITSQGDLTFTSAETYITASGRPGDKGDGFVIQSPTKVTFRGNGLSVPTPLSFGETITVRAPEIVQGGVLRAPQGHIHLDGSEQVTLAPGSITSVSLDGQTAILGAAASDQIAAYPNPGDSPTKAIRIDGPNIDLQKGSLVDVSGGGDLYAYQFQPGNGGTRDILTTPGTYAILPSYGDRAGPVIRSAPNGVSFDVYDPTLGVGSSVYLAGMPGLAAGTYTLLPARYALLPGAFTVHVQSGGLATLPTGAVARPDGAYVVGGYRLDRQLPIRDADYSEFVVTPAAIVRNYSTYIDYSFNDYATKLAQQNGLSVPELPRDAGTLVLAATQGLKLDGQGDFAAGKGGLAGGVDIAAQQIAITAPGVTAPDGYLALDADALSRFGAATLLVGGVRSRTTKGEQIQVIASDILVDDAGTPLTGSDIMLAATGTLDIASGSSVVGKGVAPADATPLLIDGDGAFVRVSAGDRREIVRSDVTGAAGLLTLADGVSLNAAGSLSLDGSQSILIDPSAVLDAAKLDISSSRISLGEVPDGIQGTILGGQTLANLSNATDLLLRSASSIDLYDGVVLGGRNANGSATLGTLTFETAALDSAGGDASITAGTVRLSNPNAAVAEAVVSGPGTFSINTDTLVLGPGSSAINGFGTTAISAGRIEGDGTGSLAVDGTLTAKTDLITADAGSDIALTASGATSVSGFGGAAQAAPTDFGGRLSITGSSLSFDTAAMLPAGVLELTASNGSLSLGDHAAIDTTGRALSFGDVVRYADGGTVRLAASGDVTAAAGSSIDVSANAGGGDAGALSVKAGGNTALDGKLLAIAAKGTGGAVSIDSATVDDFTALNQLLESGNFDAARDIRLRQQAITLADGDTIRAHEISLVSDTGAVTIDGTIDASGDALDGDGGRVMLTGAAGVTLGKTSQILAQAGAAGLFDTQSGTVTIAARGGRLDIAQGSVIDVTGGVAGGGTVTFAAMRDGADIAVDALGATIKGARDISLVGYRTYDTDTVDTGAVDAALADAAGWEAGAGAILARLGDPQLHVDPGIRFYGADALTIASDVDLHDARYGGHAGSIDFESGGDIAVNGSVSDGFTTADRSGTLLAGPSWNLGFNAGRDLTIGAGTLVRTGTGAIRLAAGRDFVLGDGLSAVYTAGAATPTVAGFDPAISSEGRTVGDFPTDGGDLTLTAGRDIVSPVAHQYFSEWLYRYGVTDPTTTVGTARVGEQSSWSILFANFEQGLGALGGGNVRISAGRDIHDLAVALPTTGHQTTAPGAIVSDAGLNVRGGGNLTLDAGRDVDGGIFMVGKGTLDVRAGGSLSSDTTSMQRAGIDPTFSGYIDAPLDAIFALMDASADIRTRGPATVEAVVDPMLIGQTCGNVGCTDVDDGFGNVFQQRGTGSAYFSNTDRTGVSVLAAAGDVTYEENPYAGIDLTRDTGEDRAIVMTVPQNGDARLTLTAELQRMPGDVAMTALQGSFVGTSVASPYTGGLLVAPSDTGNIELLAADDVRTFSVFMEDIAADYRRGALTPISLEGTNNLANGIIGGAGLQGTGNIASNYNRGLTPSHLDDTDPVRIVALDGSICAGTAGQACVAGLNSGSLLSLTLPKPAILDAGLDISNILALTQNNNGADITGLYAGRDIRFSTVTTTGIGRIELEAGRNIDQANAISAGNNYAPQLPTALNVALSAYQGADIEMQAGLADGVDYKDFADAYLSPTNAKGVVQTYLPELHAYLGKLGLDRADDNQAFAAFQALPVDQQKPLLLDIYFNELKQTGIDYNDPKSPRFQQYKRGFLAISTLYPHPAAAGEEAGFINLRGRQVETDAGGNITIVAPYGHIDVGDASSTSSDSAGGVVTRAGGDIHIMSNGSIALYTSRIFTLQGGDAILWTSAGDITAGAGSKTTLSFPPLTYLLDNYGALSLNSLGLQTGSGIGVLDAGGTTQRKKSRLDLIAPFGEVNAGDAGIRVVGDVNIAALRVVNAANIQVSGTATGVPKTVAVNTGALTAASSAASAVSTEAERLAERERPRIVPQSVPMVLTVRFLGFGS